MKRILLIIFILVILILPCTTALADPTALPDNHNVLANIYDAIEYYSVF